jgi:glycosyltransferase involved in cell wall biosynthesis
MVAALASPAVRVCIIAPVPPPYGGMSIQAQKLASRLGSEGFEVTVLSTNPVFPRRLRFSERVPGLRTVVRTLLYLRSLPGGMASSDVVHHMTVCGTYFFALTVPLVLWGKVRRKRVVLNYRGGRAPAFLKSWSWAVIPFMRMADAVIVPSEFLQRTFREYRLSTEVVSNIIDTDAFPYRLRKSLLPKLIVTRHLEPLYNVECILRAFRMVKEKFSDAELSIVGTGSEEQRLRRLCAEWKLEGVTFHGHVVPAKLPALYAAHDIFVNSSNADNFPGAVVEASCSGLPIVTTRAGGIPDMIRDHENGILVGLNDHEKLAAAVVEVLEDSELAQRLAGAARSWAEQFSWNATFTALLRNYAIKTVIASDNMRSDAGNPNLQQNQEAVHSRNTH